MLGDIDRVGQLAGPAGILVGQCGEAWPVALIRGASRTAAGTTSIRDLLVADPCGTFPLGPASPGI